MPSMIDTLGKHLEYENTQKKIVTFFLQFGHSKKKKKHGKNLLSPPCLIGLHSVTPPELRFF